MDKADEALAGLLRQLAAEGYRFVTPTPVTHARVLARPERKQARDVADVLGWSLPFADGVLPGWVEAPLAAAGLIAPDRDGLKRSLARVSRLHGALYLHSAFPTDDEDAVFFGPDSYRFADLIAAELAREAPPARARIVDIGTGAGVGAIVATGLCPRARVTATDVNRKALRSARINAAAAGADVRFVETDGLDGIEAGIDLAILNPPYIADDGDRTYSDGGDMHGGAVSVELAKAAMAGLAPAGRLILYTGSAIVGGEDPLEQALRRAADAAACALNYREIDPDVFGEELAKPVYRDVDRIAVVAAVIRSSSGAARG